MYVSGMNPLLSASSLPQRRLIIAVPYSIEGLQLGADAYGREISISPFPMLFSIAFLLFFINGGMTGLYSSVTPAVSMPLSDTLFVVAHFPHGDGGSACHGGVWCDLSLVSQNHGGGGITRVWRASISG